MSARVSALISLMLIGGIFGFFYAWICSTMWGLDAADPRIAIAAMQAMNASVRNAVFAPIFFGPPVVLCVTFLLVWRQQTLRAGSGFLAAGLIYLFGALLLTMAVNVPMNEALATQTVPSDIETAQAIWQAYSPKWQTYNILRTVMSGVALLLTGWSLMQMDWSQSTRP